MKTQLGQQAQDNMKRFDQYLTEEEREFFTKQIKLFDGLLTGYGFDAIQADIKLRYIAKLTFEEFTATMFTYFNKRVDQFQTA